LLRRILTLVARTCDPRAPHWADDLAHALAEVLYAPWPAVLQREDLERLASRVTALEADHRPPPRERTGGYWPNRVS
jgi:hypothetical protein